MGPSPRVVEPEWLDQSPAEADVQANLHDIRRLNRWFGGLAVLRAAIRQAGFLQSPGILSVLDVGAGSGDVGRELTRLRPQTTILSLDRKPLHLVDAPGKRLAGDALCLPLADRSVDIVLCAQFLHQFDNDEALQILREFRRVSRRGLILLDLLRSARAERFLAATQWLFGWHRMTVHDGTVSVRAAFRLPELIPLLEQSGWRCLHARTYWPWARLSVVATPAEVHLK